MEHEAYPVGAEMGEFSGRELKEVDAFKIEGAVVGSGECSQEGHQGGFSRPRTTTDGDEFARLDFEGNLVDGRDGTSPSGIDPAEILGGEDRAHSLFSRRSW
ncbi:MAG: hypothetical protein ABS32_03700 [Verrucomicrobia subdivision 6 bacterium BACL9 MAG-120820-bin42]|uniref:Uncharacterized protein n=1 Tax=Verrucomicrobia subdivision 6 bacterium BACL9 MAG-120820-bin42 TaxID=1655634 RepID=A0A0R2X8S4_9BACT|nr:MAG: hypothetical protein ABS32_03700 [Verrucomicrobia subdivision 6 bacterium BACL9 MAG-120820-bin42]